MKQYAVMRAKQDEEYQELHEAIEYMNERQGMLLALMEGKQKLMSGAPEDLRGNGFAGEEAGDEGAFQRKGGVPK